MEILNEIMNDNSDNQEFQKGFNDASILADYSPGLLEEISPVNNPEDDYFTGFFCGKEYCLAEKQQVNEIEELKTLRSMSKSRDNEIER